MASSPCHDGVQLGQLAFPAVTPPGLLVSLTRGEFGKGYQHPPLQLLSSGPQEVQQALSAETLHQLV